MGLGVPKEWWRQSERADKIHQFPLIESRSLTMFSFNYVRRSTAFASTVLVIFLSLTANSMQASQKSPEEVYEGRPNNLGILPEGAIRTKPIKLVVSFNLEYEPNSLEADQFLVAPDAGMLRIVRSLEGRRWHRYRQSGQNLLRR